MIEQRQHEFFPIAACPCGLVAFASVIDETALAIDQQIHKGYAKRGRIQGEWNTLQPNRGPKRLLQAGRAANLIEVPLSVVGCSRDTDGPSRVIIQIRIGKVADRYRIVAIDGGFSISPPPSAGRIEERSGDQRLKSA